MRFLRSLLPNSISLEFLKSVDTMKHGLEMNYFLNYLDRLTNLTTGLLVVE